VFYSIYGGVDWEKLEFGWPRNSVFDEQCALAVAEVYEAAIQVGYSSTSALSKTDLESKPA
jgi:hypothetical protein